MSLQFVFGPSGVGKSRYLYQQVIERAQKEPNRNFLVIVPDQFTMQTQKDFVTLSPRKGILNIDVLSFGRLTHRILEEVGLEQIPVLDDTGKSLVIQRVAGEVKEQLTVLGSFLNRQGYIHEVKSAISEFMQYGISTKDVNELIEYSRQRGALSQKLKDLSVIYQGFLSYIEGNFITTEEKLDVLKRNLAKSKLLPDSVVIFDGFTGFTPIQNRVIGELLRLCEEVILSITIGEKEDPNLPDGEQKLFYLSKKTVADLTKYAKEQEIVRKQDIYLTASDSSALRHLEQNLFRPCPVPFAEENRQIRLFETTNPREEVHQTGLEIHRLLREEGYQFRDIAMIVGDLAGYAPYVETEFENMGIPVFLDQTRGIVLNPMVEYIKSALELIQKNFSYEAVLHYLRSGMTDFSREEIDRFENYCIQIGLRGKSAYEKLFTRKLASMKTEEELSALNDFRVRLLGQIEQLLPFAGKKTAPAKQYVEALYDFLVENRVQEKLAELETFFEKEGDLSKAKEYAQIYRLVVNLLDQVIELLAEEEISLEEFSEILEAGFGEMKVGTIPQNVDRVVVGDMERTRLNHVKALFFLGVNDGNIPKNGSKGGLISDMDREFLQTSQLELAPTPRQQMYIQRFYLYLNLTKPSEHLYLSYSKVDQNGKTLRPAYLVETMKQLFPDMRCEYPQLRSHIEQIVTPAQGAQYLAEELREYAQGTLAKGEEENFRALFSAYGDETLAIHRNRYLQAAFQRYKEEGLSAFVARMLYGMQLENSVSRLETYAACAYRHFLEYGLSLQEREEFNFESADLGNIYHGVLEQFAGKLKESGYTWFDFPAEFGAKTVEEAVQAMAATYKETVLYSSARNEYAIHRIQRILTRTVLTIQSQLRKGSFQPESYELSFHSVQDLASVNLALSDTERMRLHGRIDRIDVAEDENHVYVKVVDYKSGDKKFDLVAFYYGLQLQLVVYLNAAMEHEARLHPGKEIVPAAILYYHVEDPTVETSAELSGEELNALIQKELKMNGRVNSDPYVIDKLDSVMETKSDVIPVEKKKDGTLSARSSVLERSQWELLSDYVNLKMTQLGKAMLAGKIPLNPCKLGGEDACTFCSYKRVCGFDASLPGCEKRNLETIGEDDLMLRLQEETTQKSDSEKQ